MSMLWNNSALKLRDHVTLYKKDFSNSDCECSSQRETFTFIIKNTASQRGTTMSNPMQEYLWKLYIRLQSFTFFFDRCILYYM